MTRVYIEIENLEVYRRSRELSKLAWSIYKELDYKISKIIGDQFIKSSDSIGANVAEGYGRFHYLDKIRFYYQARGSLLESKHWLEILLERGIVSRNTADKGFLYYKEISLMLNGLIRSTMVTKGKNN